MSTFLTTASRWFGAIFASALGGASIQPLLAQEAEFSHVAFAQRASSSARLERVHVQTLSSSSVWARGSTYKAHFGVSGATFIPFFGSEAATNHPVGFRVTDVRIDGESLPFDTNVAPRMGAGVVDFERGSFVERYELEVDSIEQLFVFEALPARGEIVVRIALDSDLTAGVRDGALALECDLGHVGFGRAIAIDADGQRADVAGSLVEGAIELRVPADFVARARGPLVIDPVISTFAVATSALDEFDPDVAYDAATGNWAITYEQTFSAVDHDIWVELRNGSGAFVAGDYIDTTSDYWAHGRVANHAGAQAFLVVAQVGAPTSGTRTIRGRMAAASNATLGTPFTIDGGESGDKLNPDVGGDPELSPPTFCCVVWERVASSTNHDIHARLVSGTGTLQSGGTILLDNSAALDTVPAISKSNGSAPSATQEWTVVWQRSSGPPNFEDIFGAQIHRDGTITNATFPIDVSTEDTYTPEVATLLDDVGGTRPYLVVYALYDQYFATGYNIIGAVLDGTSVVALSDLNIQINPTTYARDQLQPRADSDGKHFAVTYSELSPVGTSNYDVYFADVLYSGTSPYVCESGAVAVTSNREFNASIASAHGAGGATQRYLIAWDDGDFAGSGIRDVEAALYDGGIGGCVRPVCTGDGALINCPCGNNGSAGNGCASSVNAAGANLGWSGNPNVSADDFALIGTGMPNSSCLYFQGTAVIAGGTGSAFGDGLRCAGGGVIRLGTKTNSGGASQYPTAGDPLISIKGVIPSNGQIRWYQVWYRNAAAFCTASTFNLSNALRVVWAP